MEVDISYEYREDDVRSQVDVEALALHVMSAEGQPQGTEVSISFVTDEAIHELNRDWRGVDRPTDVLSFECDGFEDDEFDMSPTGFQPETFELGDIVIAPDVAERQAPEFGLTFADELSLLLVHGLLHLCGYDHMEDDEAEVMEARETELLSSFYGRPFKRSAV